MTESLAAEIIHRLARDPWFIVVYGVLWTVLLVLTLWAWLPRRLKAPWLTTPSAGSAERKPPA